MLAVIITFERTLKGIYFEHFEDKKKFLDSLRLFGEFFTMMTQR